MLFLRAIPFSFAIMWRYSIVLPILIIALIVFTLVATIVIMVFALISPLAAVLMLISFAVASSVIPIMVGMRLGLQAKEVRPRSSYLGLMAPALGYGLFEGLSILIILVLAMGVYLIATPMGVADFMALQRGGEEAFFRGLMDVSPILTVVLLFVGSLMIVSLRTALLVPFAGASIGKDPDGRPHTPFFGFGGGFLSNFLLVLVSFVGSALVVPIVLALSGPLGIGDTLAQTSALIAEAQVASDEAVTTEPVARIEGSTLAPVADTSAAEASPQLEALSGLWVDLAIMGVMALVLYLFFFSLQCAGAVIYFVEQTLGVRDRQAAYDAAAIADEVAEADPSTEKQDMMELMRSRMPNKKY